jgi:rubrerythrin
MKQTLINLAKAFIGESQARNRYTFYASKAKKEGYEQIAEIFQLTAANEKEHAKRIFEHIQQLKGNAKELVVESQAPTILGSTLENLKSAIEGENHEHSQMYPEFAKVAQAEKLPNIAKRLKAIAVAEKHHEERYKKLLAVVKDKTAFRKSKEVEWVCRECGYVHKGKTPPVSCPSCDHAKNFYQINCEQY